MNGPDFTNRADVPPGMQTNPSAGSERLPLIALALIGLGISIYLALYQLGVLTHVYEPYFGDGSVKVLHSPLSKMLPIPDALLGAIGYAVEILLGLIGGTARWRTSPKVVVGFGLVAGLMALVSIGLVISQPLLAHGWCTLCLCSAFASLCIVGPAMKELRAAIHELKSRRHPDSTHGLRHATP